VVVHPQSVIHSLVQYRDGSVLAELGNPDMRTPIAHALAWPDRLESGVPPLDLVETGRLEFQEPDPTRFPCLGLAFQVAEAGESAPAVLNAANEVAVAAFLDGQIRFTQIAELVDRTLQAMPPQSVEGQGLEDLMDIDLRARSRAATLLGNLR
jgi:1-deoxy-D-xylulose-5-phosphate reductoisomerase